MNIFPYNKRQGKHCYFKVFYRQNSIKPQIKNKLEPQLDNAVGEQITPLPIVERNPDESLKVKCDPVSLNEKKIEHLDNIGKEKSERALNENPIKEPEKKFIVRIT